MPRLRNLTKQKTKKQVEHITRLCIDGGNSNFELLPISRNLNRFYNIFLCGEKLCEGCKVVFCYVDDSGLHEFDTQVLTAMCHNARGEFIAWVSRWDLRRDNFRGQFSILIMIYDTDGSELARITIPIQGKVARKCRNSV